MILSYQAIKRRHAKQRQMVHPTMERTTLNGLTYGLGPAGYDVRIAEDRIMWPGRFTLASTIEEFDMPTNVLGMVCDKSTWIRRGVAVHNTVIEPGWKGFLTLEIKMVGHKFLRIKAGSPIAQILFNYLDDYTDYPYEGKYQNQQAGPQPAIL